MKTQMMNKKRKRKRKMIMKMKMITNQKLPMYQVKRELKMISVNLSFITREFVKKMKF